MLPDARNSRSSLVVQRVILDGRGSDRTPVVPACFCAGVASTPRTVARAAEHAYAADRFAHEIVPFLKASSSALAAADRHTVRRFLSLPVPMQAPIL